ncbi:hypothetical protein E0Z10_g10147 [Xylaria hypoxylon]|uniref:Uncharacterized protein n=1 Tax=Xylaria hypoxylon TaxID=37992 RepID=A0A4Z0Y3Q5_9PEZI|nr:hypothetical protein E0Z10_g10147 [Xylaria hypoxylon]
MAPSHPVTARVLIPMKLDAFVLNSAVCSGTGADQAKIAPITAPNYTYLRLDDTLLRPDVLDHVDLHHTAPSQYNSRFTNLGTGATRANREGVYLHWTLPRPYRAGSMKDDQSGRSSDADVSAPKFFDLPTRWLVIRALDKDTVKPESARDSVPDITAWVVEGDRQWELDELDVNVDLQVDVSPFISSGEGVDLEEQAEVFIGAKTPLADWKGEKSDDTIKRAKLSMLQSSNPLFADYQPHNSNVFSIVDTFAYTSTSSDTTENQKTEKKLTAATAGYYVLGWHSEENHDLFATVSKSRASRLQELGMALKSEVGAGNWSKSPNCTRSLCHAALYDVKWNVNDKPPTVLVDRYASILNRRVGSAVSVGATSLDALIAFIAAQKASSTTTNRSGGTADDSSEKSTKELEEIIFAMQGLLHAHDDGVDSRLEAADQVSNWNYSRSDGGSVFHSSSSSPGTSNKMNDDGNADKINTLNHMQTQLDATRRAQRQTRWNLFSLWWKCITNSSRDNTKYKEEVNQQSDYLKKLQTLSASLETRIASIAVNAKKTAGDYFHEQRDPTLLVAGIPSAWPYDFRDKLEVRLDSQTVGLPKGIFMTDDIEAFIEDAAFALPISLRSAAKALMTEFIALGQDDDSVSSSSTIVDSSEVYPLYHDQGWNPSDDINAPWRDNWNETQPWSPLFLEWGTREPLIRGGIRSDIVLYELKEALAKDIRLLSGRALILPQPAMTLQALVAQIISNTTDEELRQAGISRDQVRKLQDGLYHLPFISAPLAGFHDHLATRSLGNHVKPNNRLSSDKLEPIDQAVREDAGLTKEVLRSIQTHTNPAPYAFLTDFSSNHASPFKPAVHGQFKFTKLNIIDKFGQAIHAINPTPRPRSQGIPPLYPCISDFYEPQVVLNEDGTVHRANTVTEEDQGGRCRYIQVPPHINQPVRFNGAFVTREQSKIGGKGYWRPAADEDIPIWGWIVVNRADNGLQFFCADGSFYCEVRLGGPSETQETKWLPFGPPTLITDSPADGATTRQFKAFVSQFSSPQYLRAFAETVELALQNLPAAPKSYADHLNAAIGKPLALVNMAWSLELAAPEYTNQSCLFNESADAKPESLGDHMWQVKLGDNQRAFDGLVAYFKARDDQDTGAGEDTTTPLFDYETFYTYYHRHDVHQQSSVHGDTGRSSGPLCPITNVNYPAFKSFWLDPLKYEGDYERYYIDRCRKLTAFAAVLDPFTSVHAFSSFFPMGPLVIPGDVAPFQQEFSLQAGHSSETIVPGSAVPIPALKEGDWAWLQPYNVSAAADGEDADAEDDQAYMPLGLSMLVDGRPRLEPGPYTAIEGFLQLKTPMLRQTSNEGDSNQDT